MLIGSQALVNDPYRDNVVLHLRGYDAQSGQVFKDYSKYNRTISVAGNTSHSTTQKKYGNSSIYFDGTGDYLTVPASSDFSFGTGDFTIEAWVRWDGTFSSDGRVIYATGLSGSLDQFGIFSANGVYFGGVSTLYYPPVNEWVHISAVRSNGVVSIYVNKENVGSGVVWSSIGSSSATVFIGVRGDGFHPWLGNIEDLRITSIARQIAVPTQPFPNW